MTDEEVFKDNNDNVRLPQPHENIRALQQQGNPILDNPGMRMLIGELTYKLRHARLFGGQKTYHEYENMTKVEEGNLVVVVDPFRFGHAEDVTKQQAVGYFLGVREEWATSDEDWQLAQVAEDYDGSPRRIEHAAFYIQYGPYDVCRWVNCEVVKIG